MDNTSLRSACVAVIRTHPPQTPDIVRRRTLWSCCWRARRRRCPRHALGGGVVLDVARARGRCSLRRRYALGGGLILDVATRSRVSRAGALAPSPRTRWSRAHALAPSGRRVARGLALASLRSVPPGASQAPPFFFFCKSCSLICKTCSRSCCRASLGPRELRRDAARRDAASLCEQHSFPWAEISGKRALRVFDSLRSE